MMKVAGAKITLEQSLFARMADELAFQSWAKTKDGQKNRNRPKSILQALTSDHDNENEAFTTPEDFKKAWERIVRSSHAE